MSDAWHRFWTAAGVSIVLALGLVTLLWWQPAISRRHADQNPPLVMYCAAGIRPPVEAVLREYERRFGVRVQLQYGGSGTLLGNVRVAKTGDLFLAADAQTTLLAREQGLLAETIPLARLRPVIAVRKGNPKRIVSLQDLLRADVDLALANPEAASVGKVTRAALTNAGQWEQVRSHARVFKPTVGDVANDIKLGTVDAGIIWDATARQYPELEMVPVSELNHALETVAVGVLKCSRQPTAALRLARFLSARDAGLQEFGRQGYQPIDGDLWAETPELVLYSGAMNRAAVEETLRTFEQREGVRVTRVYNGCGILVAQMKAGARPDAYLTCDKSFVAPVADLFPENAMELSDSAIVLLVPKGNPKHLSSLRDLAQKGLRIGVANEEQSTLGALTKRLLQQEHVFAPAMANVVTQVPTADLLVNQMRTGALDAAVVYASNSTPVRGQLDVVELGLPQALAVQTFSISKDSKFKYLAARLLEALQSQESQSRYAAAGFHWRGADKVAQIDGTKMSAVGVNR
jgi:molybdate transport system substrate-binding protein